MSQNSSDAIELQEKPVNFAASPDFKWLCDELFVKLDNVSLNIATPTVNDNASDKPIYVRYYEIISNFIELWRKTVGNDFYPIMILILPYRDRRTYNIKDYTLIKAICKYLKLSRNSFTEKRLLNWKQRASRNMRLSTFLIKEIAKRRSEPTQLSNGERISIDKLNQLLDELSLERNLKGRGYKNLAESESFKYCMDNMSFIELKYFFDIILKTRIIGGQEHKFLDAWHPDAKDYLSVVSDLKILTDTLWNPSIRLRNEDLNIKLGNAFAPHAAKRLTLSYATIVKKLNSNFFIEEKMDGERIQIHYSDYGNNIKYFSRHGTDYTYLYGSNITMGTISLYLKLNDNVKECVLDGEMITYDKTNHKVLPFGLLKSSARNRLTQDGISNDNYHPLFMAFDVVYLNGISLIDIPLFQRKSYLSSILTPYKETVEIISFIHCKDEEAIKQYLTKAIEVGSEGVVLKNYNSRYMIGSRNDAWIKVKPEYLEQFGENMDLVVIGKIPGKKNSYMCGLVVTDEGEDTIADDYLYDEEGVVSIINLDSSQEDASIDLDTNEKQGPLNRENVKFISFCSIANGISIQESEDIERMTRNRWKKWEDIRPSKDYIEFGSKTPFEWIDPKESVVLEIKARSIDNAESKAGKYKTGCTLYGGYCRSIRDDKDWSTCYTLTEFKRDKRHRPAKPKSRSNAAKFIRKRRKTKFLLNNIPNINNEVNSNIFDNLKFYIISDYFDNTSKKRIDKNDLKTLALKNGGTVVHNLLLGEGEEKNLRIISGKHSIETNTLAKRGYDIIDPKWIIDCITDSRLLRLEPQYCFTVSEELLQIAQKRVDILGDSYEVLLTPTRLSELIQADTSQYINEEIDMENIDNDIRETPHFLLSNRNVFIPERDAKEYNAVEFTIELYGGRVVRNFEQCNLAIIIHPEDDIARFSLKKMNREISVLIKKTDRIPSIPAIVSKKWLDDSIMENAQVPEEDYIVHI